MKGTMRSLVCAMRLMPPRITSAATMSSTMPMMRESQVELPVMEPRESTDSLMEAICPMLPMPKEAISAKMENSTASTRPMTLQCFLEPRPSCR